MKEIKNLINKIEINEKIEKKQVVCLGFFDCLHLGHIKLINAARLIAHRDQAELSVFTFSNNPFKFFNNKKQILNFDERCFRLEELFVNNVIYSEFNQAFANLEPIDFLNKLIKDKNISSIVVGDDYTFGKKAKGNINLLKTYCDNNNIVLYVVDMYLVGKNKLSSTYIRNLVENGDVKKISFLLDDPYIIKGKVIKGRGVGSKINMPTANIALDPDKIILKEGVYHTNTIIDGVTFKSVTNIGTKPTFSDNTISIETHIIYYNKTIYDKDIVVEFINRIRDIKTFNNEEELVKQINEDIKTVLKEDKND